MEFCDPGGCVDYNNLHSCGGERVSASVSARTRQVVKVGGMLDRYMKAKRSNTQTSICRGGDAAAAVVSSPKTQPPRPTKKRRFVLDVAQDEEGTVHSYSNATTPTRRPRSLPAAAAVPTFRALEGYKALEKQVGCDSWRVALDEAYGRNEYATFSSELAAVNFSVVLSCMRPNDLVDFVELPCFDDACGGDGVRFPPGLPMSTAVAQKEPSSCDDDERAFDALLLESYVDYSSEQLMVDIENAANAASSAAAADSQTNDGHRFECHDEVLDDDGDFEEGGAVDSDDAAAGPVSTKRSKNVFFATFTDNGSFALKHTGFSWNGAAAHTFSFSPPTRHSTRYVPRPSKRQRASTL